MKAGCKISQKQPAVVKVKMLFSILQKEGKRSIVKLGEMICEIKVHLASNSIFSKSSSALDTAGCSCTHVSLGEAVPAHHFGGAGPQHLTVQHYIASAPCTCLYLSSRGEKYQMYRAKLCQSPR